MNRTRFTQTVLGLGPAGGRLGPGAPDGDQRYRLQMTPARGPSAGLATEGLSGHFPIAIPPGDNAVIRLQWYQVTCRSVGIENIIDDIQLKVRVGATPLPLRAGQGGADRLEQTMCECPP